MADADYYIGPDWCHARCPDEKQWVCKPMVEWDMRSCTVKQQREFLDAIRMLKKEARQ